MDVSAEILDIARQYLGYFKKSGSQEINAICPFHVKADGRAEQHPSFYMNVANGLYFCHSCQSRGNLYTFLRDVGLAPTDISFRYQLVLDAARKSMPLKMSPLDPKVVGLDPLPDSMLGLFDYCPTSLLSAGFREETLREFDVGFDHDHNRVTFPLRDIAGQLVGISGRDVEGYRARYKVYDIEYRDWGMPERSLDKRIVLWNAHRVYPELFFSSAPSDLVIVEGFKACMWVHQAGIKNVVATLGTYLSDEQLWIIERLGSTVYLFFDHNEAGYKAFIENGEKLSRSKTVKVMEYPARVGWQDDAQPDNLSEHEVLEAKGRAVDFLAWLHGLN